MIDLSTLSHEDEAARENAFKSRASDMISQTQGWASINTGSWNIDGLRKLAPMLADAFAELDAEVRLEAGDPVRIGE
jgi:glutamate carboxypeptidase